MSKVKTKLECFKCNNFFSARGGNFKKHINSCDGSYNPSSKLVSCKYCDIIFDEFMSTSLRANHSRWCIDNPKRDYYNKSTNNGLQLRTPDAIKKRIESIKKAHADGKYKQSYEKKKGKPGTPHSKETKQILREKALASPHRRLVRSIREYTKKDGSIIMLDSSWEEFLALRLDSLGIHWNRPSIPIKWQDNSGKFHNYFPDFYLPEYDIFLDPKNPYAVKVQREKLEIIKTLIPNLRILTTLKECNEFTI